MLITKNKVFKPHFAFGLADLDTFCSRGKKIVYKILIKEKYFKLLQNIQFYEPQKSSL